MMKPIIVRSFLRAAMIGVLALAFPTAFFILHAQDKAASGGVSSLLAKNIIGTWVLVGKPGEVGDAPAAGGRLKFLTGTHWCDTQADPKTGVVLFHHGGTYTLNGNDYVQTTDYASPSTKNFIGKSGKFTIRVEGDTLTLVGIGNPWNEVWKRLN